ncbi:TPA: DUF905 domain-containing protein, partial [Klebsiella pneumoniae]|nr:DUF905 domain-containing protein [Klebsiella pneumoniae]
MKTPRSGGAEKEKRMDHNVLSPL